ncbi:MAG: 3-phosphoserine/phosphohydroxythreonine transaminase [Candidatus Acidiferrales bacterium]
MASISSSSPLKAGLKRAYNFSGGPATLPLAVLEKVRDELLDYRGTGMSVMEMSHRSPEYEEINSRAEQLLRRLMAIPEEYAVIFLQGGGSMQFTMMPLNLHVDGKPVDVLHTGMWTAKAIAELKKSAPYRIAATSEPEKFTRIPRANEIDLASDASYVYMCSNNTIEGTQWRTMPRTGEVPLVADMSSDILSRQMNVRQFGAIFAGAQKNLGQSGATVVIIRKDLAERADPKLPSLLQYRTEIKEHSLFHTPPTFAVYVLGLMLEWLEGEGGTGALERRNEAKARLLYEAIDSSSLYKCPVEQESRSRMNVVFRLGDGDEELESRFAKEAATEGIAGIVGHRSVGGMRVSLYNAVTIESVEALVGFMKHFESVRA